MAFAQGQPLTIAHFPLNAMCRCSYHISSPSCCHCSGFAHPLCCHRSPHTAKGLRRSRVARRRRSPLEKLSWILLRSPTVRVGVPGGSKPKFQPADSYFLMHRVWPGFGASLGIQRCSSIKYNRFGVKKTLCLQGWTGCAAASCALPGEHLHITAGSRGAQ